MREPIRGVLAVLALALVLTGCGAGDEGAQVASTGGEASAGASSAPAGLSADEKAVKFTQCLRENGLQVPDPEPGKGPMIRFDKGSGVTKEKVEAAMEACREFNPQATGGGSADPKMEERGRKYAECMRKNGVEAFADPKPGQRGIIIDGKVGSDPDFEKAKAACQSVLSRPATPGSK